jgi:type II secretory pathway component GspD/PulD (secretin)
VDPRANVVVVTDVPESLATVARLIEDLDRELVTKTWLINYSQPEDIASRIEVKVPPEMGEIVVDEMTHQVTVTAIPERIKEIDELIAMWDVPRRQVHIEAYLVTASSLVARNLGVNWAYFDEIGNKPFSLWQGSAPGDLTSPPATGDRFAIGTLPVADYATDAAGNPIEDIAGNPVLQGWLGNDIAATLSYLDSRGQVTILSQGRVTVQDGEEASFENTSQVPYSQSTTELAAGDDFRQRTEIAFVDVGTILKVLPRLSEHDNILMEISAEDSSSEFVSFTSNGEVNTAPQKRQNRAETIVMVNDAQTLVIGGLRQSNFTDNEERFPFLSDLPLVGRAFKTTTRNHDHTDLLIFITCTIVGPGTSPEAISLAEHDADLANAMRLDRKPSWQRWMDKLSKGATEIGVSIGQEGDIFAEGEPATLPELRELFAEVKTPQSITVAIRHHPRAPEDVVKEVADAAAEARLRTVFDNTTPAFVPALN